jgi:hypothetical protein
VRWEELAELVERLGVGRWERRGFGEDGDDGAGGGGEDGGEEGVNVEVALELKAAELLRGLNCGPAGDEELAEGVLIDELFGGELVVGRFGNEAQVDGSFATSLPSLAAGFLEGHVEAGEGFKFALIEGDALGGGEDFFGGEIVGGHQLALAGFAELLKLIEGHSTKIHEGGESTKGKNEHERDDGGASPTLQMRWAVPTPRGPGCG